MARLECPDQMYVFVLFLYIQVITRQNVPCSLQSPGAEIFSIALFQSLCLDFSLKILRQDRKTKFSLKSAMHTKKFYDNFPGM